MFSLSPSLLAMNYHNFTFPWCHVGCWFTTKTTKSLVDLPNDVLLEEVFDLLEIKDIISLRRVNKRLYALTHESFIWKCLLRRMNIPLPPLPPTTRHSVASLNNLEVERLLIRAVSLQKNFQLLKPEPFYAIAAEAFHRIQSMVMLPGGKYLVASVKDDLRDSYAIMIFVLDYRIGGTIAVAKTSTPTKAYNLQAKYMVYQDQRGIMLSYTLRDTKYKKHRRAAGGVHISEMSIDTVLDIPVPMVYKCITLFTTLGSLDKLSDPVAFHPGSKAYNLFAIEQNPPFRLIAEVRSSSSLGPICMEEIFGVPYMAVVKSNDQIVFKNLLIDGYSTLTCPSFGAPREKYAIKKIRFLPPQASIFVIRRVERQCLLFETYPIPFLGERVSNVNPVKTMELRRPDLDHIEITDNPPLASRHYNLDLDSPPDLTGQASRSISIFGTSAPDGTSSRMICRVGLVAKPWTDDRPLPRVPFPLPVRLENNPVAKERFIEEYATHFYEIQPDSKVEPMAFNSKFGRMRVLPGSNYSLVYWTADSIQDCSNLTNLGIYFTPPPLGDPDEGGGDEEETQEVDRMVVDGSLIIRRKWRMKFPCLWQSLFSDLKSKPMRCIAWDESIGRMCLVHDNDTTIYIMDFAQAPREDAKGERLPIPAVLYENPSRSSLFDGRFFFNTKL